MRFFAMNEPGDVLFRITEAQFAESCVRAGESGHEFRSGDSDADFAAGLAWADVLLAQTSALVHRFPAAAPDLRMIFLLAAGVDKLQPFSDLPPGVPVLNNSGVHSRKAGEYSAMALLMLNAHVPEMLTQQRATHGRAFDMPTRPASAEFARVLGICGFIRLGSLPKHEIKRVLLAVIDRYAFTRTQVVQRFARQLAITRKLAHRKIHITVAGPIGQALAFELADQAEHLPDIVGRARLMGRPLNPHCTDVPVHRRDHLVGQRANRDAALKRTPDDLVIDVSDIAHIGDAVAALLEPALHHIEGHHHSRMADMAEIVNRHAADIHAHLTRHERGKRLDRTGQGVVDAKGHGATRPASA